MNVKSSEMQAAMKQIIDEIAVDIIPIRPEGFGVTAGELAKQLDCDANTARKELDKRVESGRMLVSKMRWGNASGSVYCPAGFEV